MSPEETTRKPGAADPSDQPSGGFSAAEQAAMKERAQELKTEARRGVHSKDGEADVLAKIAELPDADRTMALRVHEVVKAAAPALAPRTWYGMPAYALKGKVVCFFQGANKFGSRYSTLGFSDSAQLDEGDLWPTAFALKELTPVVEAQITALVKRAVG